MEFPVLWFVLHPSKKRQGVFFSFKKGNGSSQGLICLSNNLYRRRCTKTKQILSASLDSMQQLHSRERFFREIFMAWMKITPFFPGKLLKSNFVTFLVLVGLDFSQLPNLDYQISSSFTISATFSLQRIFIQLEVYFYPSGINTVI